MKMEKTQLLNELRILFFQKINTVNTNIDYQLFVNTLLSFVKDRLGLEDVSYFRYDDWKQQFYLDATSNGKTEEFQKSLKISGSLIEKLKSTESDRYFFSNHSLSEFPDYQAIISIQREQKVLGFIVFKEKTLGTFSLNKKEEWIGFFKSLLILLKQ